MKFGPLFTHEKKETERSERKRGKEIEEEDCASQAASYERCTKICREIAVLLYYLIYNDSDS